MVRSDVIGAGRSSQSVDDAGEEILKIKGKPMTISANAQKQDNSSEELTI